MNPNIPTLRRWNAAAVLAVVVTISGAPLLRAAAPTPVGEPVVGEQRRWTLTFRTQLEQPGGRPVAVDLSGDWISTVSAVRADEYDVRLQLANVRLGGTVNAPAAQVEQFRQRLERPFWATRRADGSLLAVHFY